MEACTPEEVGIYEVYVTLHGDQVCERRPPDEQHRVVPFPHASTAYIPTRSLVLVRKRNVHTFTDAPLLLFSLLNPPIKQGYPNEISLLQNTTDHADLSYLSPVILRFYGVDPSMGTSHIDGLFLLNRD